MQTHRAEPQTEGTDPSPEDQGHVCTVRQPVMFWWSVFTVEVVPRRPMRRILGKAVGCKRTRYGWHGMN